MTMIQTWLLFCMVYLKANFYIYINDLNQAIKFCKVHHFPKLNKFENLDMKNLSNSLNANVISLNVQKTELVLFKNQRKKIDSEVKGATKSYFTHYSLFSLIRLYIVLHFLQFLLGN